MGLSHRHWGGESVYARFEPWTPRMDKKITALARGLWLAGLALALLAKAIHANSIADTFWQDPIEIWIAVGVAVLLIERCADVVRRSEESRR